MDMLLQETEHNVYLFYSVCCLWEVRAEKNRAAFGLMMFRGGLFTSRDERSNERIGRLVKRSKSPQKFAQRFPKRRV
jgi:hypothetical protein